MIRLARPAPERGDPLFVEMIRLLRLQRRVRRLEWELERLRRREDSAFRAFHRICDAESGPRTIGEPDRPTCCADST
jgi:hypothetical protein